MMAGVMTALLIGLVLAAWTVLPLPLAVLVGRAIRAGRLVTPHDAAVDPAVDGAAPVAASI